MSNLRKARTESTRRNLVRVGRSLFQRRGFTDVSAEEIVAAASLTRGALYHHFNGKEGLFRAVVSDAMSEVCQRVAVAAASAHTPLEALELGVRSFLDACAEQEYLQVLLIDGPAVLGWHDWRALDLEHALGLLRRGLEAALAAREIAAPDIETTTHLLAGALIDGAMLIGRDPGNASVRRRVEVTILRFVHCVANPQRKRRRLS